MNIMINEIISNFVNNILKIHIKRNKKYIEC